MHTVRELLVNVAWENFVNPPAATSKSWRWGASSCENSSSCSRLRHSPVRLRLPGRHSVELRVVRVFKT